MIAKREYKGPGAWGVGVGKMGKCGQKLQTSSYKYHADVMYSIVTIVNKTILYIC